MAWRLGFRRAMQVSDDFVASFADLTNGTEQVLPWLGAVGLDELEEVGEGAAQPLGRVCQAVGLVGLVQRWVIAVLKTNSITKCITNYYSVQ